MRRGGSGPDQWIACTQYDDGYFANANLGYRISADQKNNSGGRGRRAGPRMEKKLLCALTHARQESFFLAKWINYYGAIVGRENLYVVLDGDDWEPEVDLTGINVEVVLDGPRKRRRNDQWAASTMSKKANFLRKSHEFVIRGDVDEYVVVDPACGLGWEEALRAVGDQGYTFALGIDMVQRPAETTPLDASKPILSQRRFGFVADRYTKPFVIWRWNNWSGGAHRLLNRGVIMNPHFVLFHMALCDVQIAQERMDARGGQGQHASFVGHQNDRLNTFNEVSDLQLLPYEDAVTAAFKDFPVESDGSVAKRPRASAHPLAHEKGLFTTVPERFSSLV